MSTRSSRYSPVDLSKVKLHSISRRRSLVSVSDFAALPEAGASFEQFLASLPDVLAAKSLRRLAAAMVEAYRQKRPVVWAIGAHVVKCGLNPVLIDLMERGLVGALAMNGACAIHDFELASAGETSEDVAEGLEDGSFGMVKETGDAYRQAASDAARQGIGLGRAFGQLILRSNLKYSATSLLAAGAKLGVPVTIHVGIGTDIVYMHPRMSGADLGEASYTDFKILCAVATDLEGGVWLNVGSAVILPEVFLKALTVARNLGHKVKSFTTANLDMIQHYRPTRNVLERPGGDKIAIIGHHELTVPLLRMIALEQLKKKVKS